MGRSYPAGSGLGWGLCLPPPQRNAVLLRIDAREFAIVNYAYELCKILIGFLVFGLIFGLLSNVPVYVMLIVPLFVVCAKLTVSAFILWSYENHNHGKIKINVSENRLGSFKVILVILFLAAAYGLPALGFCPPVSALFVLMLVVIVIGVFSCRRIVTFDKYRIVYGQILKDMDSMVESVQNMDVDKNRKLISAENESLEQNSRIEKKKGFEYLNAVFINRHKRLLWKPVKRVCAICILLVAAGIGAMLYLDDAGFRKDTAELLLKNLGMSTFWMYLINRGMGYTQALFMNCDHSLLCYPFYRKPKAVLELFTIRLREIIKINLPPALILGAGLSAMLFIAHGTQNPLNYLILFLVFPKMFSCEHLERCCATNLRIRLTFFRIQDFLLGVNVQIIRVLQCVFGCFATENGLFDEKYAQLAQLLGCTRLFLDRFSLFCTAI